MRILSSHWLFPGFDWHHRLLPRFDWHHQLLPGFDWHHRLFPGFDWHHRLLPGFDWIVRFLPGFDWIIWSLTRLFAFRKSYSGPGWWAAWVPPNCLQRLAEPSNYLKRPRGTSSGITGDTGGRQVGSYRWESAENWENWYPTCLISLGSSETLSGPLGTPGGVPGGPRGSQKHLWVPLGMV